MRSKVIVGDESERRLPHQRLDQRQRHVLLTAWWRCRGNASPKPLPTCRPPEIGFPPRSPTASALAISRFTEEVQPALWPHCRTVQAADYLGCPFLLQHLRFAHKMAITRPWSASIRWAITAPAIVHRGRFPPCPSLYGGPPPKPACG
jgi:hypothetical protein